MKKLKKIHINPARLMKNEELIIIRGGYDGPCTCICATYNPDPNFCGVAQSPDGDCNLACQTAPGCSSGEHTWGECM